MTKKTVHPSVVDSTEDPITVLRRSRKAGGSVVVNFEDFGRAVFEYHVKNQKVGCTIADKLLFSDTENLTNEAFEIFHGGVLEGFRKNETTLVTYRESDYDIRLEARQGGNEGGGSDTWAVFEIDGILFKVEGWYSSYNGTDWDSSTLKIVEPSTQTITVYG